MGRGHLRIYVGAATGVGTSHAMLAEGLRRRRDGATVVLACLDADGPAVTEAMARRLTPLPPAALDVAAVLAARPDVALVDDVGGRESDGRRRADEVARLLDAGVDVVSTLWIAQVATLADAAGAITGVPIADIAPDELLATAEIELVDATPETMRDRIARGDVLPATSADVALYNGPAYAALRALAMSWLADRLAAVPGAGRHARERVVVAVSDGPGSGAVVRRAARLAQRSHAQLVGVRVRRPGADEDLRTLADRRRLVVELGGDYQEVESAAIADALVSFARAEEAGQLVLGATPSGRRRRRRAGSVVTDVLARADDIDVHVVPRPDARAGPTRWPWSRESPISHGRRVAGFVGGAALLVALTGVLVAIRDHVSVSTAMSLQLLAVALIAAVGGLGPGLAAAIAAPLLVNWFLIPPYHTLRIGDTENLVSLLVFMSVAALVSAFVSTAARRAAEAERLRDEAHTLASLVGVGGPDPMGAIAAHLVDSFHLDGVAVFRVDDGGSGTVVEATAGLRPPATIAEATFHRLVGPDVVLAAAGPPLTSEDDRVLRSFLQQLERALEQRRLAAVAADAEALSHADALRTSLLRAVSHDLRTPLANVKAAVSSLRRARRGVVRGRPRGLPRGDRGRHGSAHRDHHQPARPVEAAGRRHASGDAADIARRGRRVGAPPARAFGRWRPAGHGARGRRGRRRPGPARAGRRQPRRERARLVAAGRPGAGCGPPGRRSGPAARGRPRAWHPGTRPAGGGPAVPPPRRRVHRRARSRAGDRRPDDGRDGRRPGALGHARWRADGGRVIGVAVTRVLCVDDEPQLLRTLGANLTARHYDVDLVTTGEQALEAAAARRPDVVVLDLGLPGMSGLDVIRALRRWTEVPIVVLSARDGEFDKIAALDAGADDYVAKPFGMGELLARLRAALRRPAPGEEAPVVATPELTIDLVRRTARREGSEVKLTPTEWHLVEVLLRNQGRLVTGKQLLQQVWGPQYLDETNYLRVHMAHIRRKLEPVPGQPRYFHTEAGMGYRFDPPAE